MATKRALFWQLIIRAIIRRRLHLIIMLLAIAIGVAVVSAMTNLYTNLSDQLSQQFRQYGANVVVKAKKGSLNKQEVARLAAYFKNSVVAYSSFAAQMAKVEQKPVVVVGVNLKQLPLLYPYWQIKGRWPLSNNEVLVGQEAAKKLALKPGKTVTLAFTSQKKEQPKKVSGVFVSGGQEEAQIFTSLTVAKPQTAYFSIIGQGEQLQEKLKLTKTKFPQLKVAAIRRLAVTEAKVLNQIKYLVWLVAFIILITSVLGVATTLTSLVVERRQEIALKKALGAENEQITWEFLSESLLLGLAGGFIGWLIGLVLAQWISKVVFNAIITVSALSFFLAFSLALLVSVVAATMPVRMALKIEPAVVLKGE